MLFIGGFVSLVASFFKFVALIPLMTANFVKNLYKRKATKLEQKNHELEAELKLIEKKKELERRRNEKLDNSDIDDLRDHFSK